MGKAQGKKAPMHFSGFRDLDRLTSGMQRGDLVILAARPSMGKTALCLNIAQHVALHKGEPVGMFSLLAVDVWLWAR